jgi:hypothetical protein
MLYLSPYVNRWANAGTESGHRRLNQNAGDDATDAFSIRTFCQRHQLSQSFYFKIKKLGLGPREMAVGKRILISREAAADWRRERETAAKD